MKKTRFTAAFMAAAIALTCVPFTAASAQEVPEEYAAERELGWYDDDEYISWEAVDDSEEAYETVEAEEPEIYAWESGATTYNSTELGWSYVDGAAKYRVYKYSPSKGKYVKYKDVTKTTVNVTGLKAGTSYKFMVASLVKKNGKYVVQNKSAEYTVATSAKSSGSNSNANNTIDGSQVKPGKWIDPTLGNSRAKVLKSCGIGKYTIEKDTHTAHGKVYYGRTLYSDAELECSVALAFNSDDNLYQYILQIPCTYLIYLDVIDTVKSKFDYDYRYYDGYYFFGSSLYQMSMTYDNGYCYIFVDSSLYKY